MGMFQERENLESQVGGSKRGSFARNEKNTKN